MTAWMIILVPGGLLVVLLAFITLNRYIRYKERVALAQLGLSLEDMERQESHKRHGNRGVLWGGVITATSGMALYLGLATIGTGVWLLGGLIPAFVGAGMILIYFMTLGSANKADEEQSPVLNEDEPECIAIENADDRTNSDAAEDESDEDAENAAFRALDVAFAKSLPPDSEPREDR